jgi:hypothetical protein
MTVGSKVEATLAAFPLAEVSRAAVGWAAVSARVEARSAGEGSAPNIGLQQAGAVLLGWVRRLGEADVAPRVARLASIGEVSVDLLTDAESVAWAAVYVRRKQLETAALHSAARVDAEVDASTKALRETMLRVLAYHLGHDAGVSARLEGIRGGSGYLDRANDLEALAELYEAHAATLAVDTVYYRAADAARAREAAERLYRVVGVEAEGEAAAWTARAAKLWPEVTRVEAALRRVGLFLLPGAEGEKAFGSLVGSARARPQRAAGVGDGGGEGA